MNGCLNVLWHFPFFGFLFAFFYALFGALLCCTVVLYPVGLGYLQIARFLLSPFTSALVSRKELDRIRPEERSTAAATYSTLIKVLYVPFGLIAAGCAVFVVIGEFLSLIGIPCGIVWFKTLPSIFNPVDKVCVPKAVADEIERLKAGATLSRFKGEGAVETTPSEDTGSGPVRPEPDAALLPSRPEVRSYEDDRLHEIVSDAAMYKASLVEACRRELEIREKGAALLPKIAGYDDPKLREVLANPQLYSDEVLYCCQRVFDERRRRWEEQQAREAEQARIERERQAGEEAERREKAAMAARKRRTAAWKKWRYPLFAVTAAALCLSVTAYLISNTHRYNRAVKFAEAGLAEKAVGRLALIDNPKFGRYSEAKYLLYTQQLILRDSAAAAEALIAATAAGDWRVQEAYERFAEYCMKGTFSPYIQRSEMRAARLYRFSPKHRQRLLAGRLYFNRGQFLDADAIFSPIMHLPEAKGYLGLMLLYGLGSRQENAQTAWEYLRDAPDEPPFLVPKGDLSLFARDKDEDRNNRFEAIRQADYYYQLANQQEPENRAVALRAEVTRRMLAAYDRHEERRRAYWSDSKWDSYTFETGSYEGEYGCWGNECGAQGWGCFTWNNDRSMWLGFFVNGKLRGLGIRITDFMHDQKGGLGTDLRISVGQFRNDAINGEGYFTGYKGTMECGTWKDSELINGVKRDVLGNVIETVK